MAVINVRGMPEKASKRLAPGEKKTVGHRVSLDLNINSFNEIKRIAMRNIILNQYISLEITKLFLYQYKSPIQILIILRSQQVVIPVHENNDNLARNTQCSKPAKLAAFY